MSAIFTLGIQIAVKMLTANKPRLVVTVIGVATAFFLAAAQVGLLCGWVNTVSAILINADADIWVMAQQTPAFDYGTSISRNNIYLARNVEGVTWAEGMFMAWNVWQRDDGRRISIELVGLDDSSVGGPWKMLEGDVETVHLPDTVIVDEISSEALGVDSIGSSFEMNGERAIIGGISQGVRTFTASPWIFTSIKSALNYDKRYRSDEITYVVARCDPNISPSIVRDRMIHDIPSVEILTSQQFIIRTVKYWMLETGVGITVVFTAVLGLAVGAIITSQTLFAITQDHLPNYATLLAIGFSRKTILLVVLMQSMTLATGGIVFGGVLFTQASRLAARSPIPLEMSQLVFSGLSACYFLSCLAASFISVKSIFKIEPVQVFRQ